MIRGVRGVRGVTGCAIEPHRGVTLQPPLEIRLVRSDRRVVIVLDSAMRVRVQKG